MLDNFVKFDLNLEKNMEVWNDALREYYLSTLKNCLWNLEILDQVFESVTLTSWDKIWPWISDAIYFLLIKLTKSIGSF